MRINIQDFKGMVPKESPRNLDPNYAQLARDAQLWSGELSPMREEEEVKVIPSLPQGEHYKTLYKYDRPGELDPQWLLWKKDVYLTKGPVENDEYNRIYLSLDGQLRAFDSTMLSASSSTIDGTNSALLAVKFPTGDLRMELVGSGDQNPVGRSYIITYVREWADGKQDESAPSAPFKDSNDNISIDVHDGQTIKLTGITKYPDTDSGNVKYVRIYRSATGAQSTDYLFVDEFELNETQTGNPDATWDSGTSTFSYDDKKKDDELGEPVKSMDWTAPIDGLRGLVSLRNGVLAAHTDNDVYFSEPYQPHAWPSIYKVTLDYKIVGLGHFGNNVVVCTDAYPFMLNVQDPATVVPIPINELAPCLSAKSIVNANGAVFYAAPNGILAVDTSRPSLYTQNLIYRTQWMEYNPSSMMSAFHTGKYITFFQKTDGTSGGLIVDFAEASNGITEMNVHADCVYLDDDDTLYYVIRKERDTTAIVKHCTSLQCRKSLYWKSAEIVVDGIKNFSAARVDFYNEVDGLVMDITSPPLGAFNDHPVHTFTINGDVYPANRDSFVKDPVVKFNLYMDKKLVFSKILKDSKPFRLPTGMRGRSVEFELISNRTIKGVTIAPSMGELE